MIIQFPFRPTMRGLEMNSSFPRKAENKNKKQRLNPELSDVGQLKEDRAPSPEPCSSVAPKRNTTENQSCPLNDLISQFIDAASAPGLPTIVPKQLTSKPGSGGDDLLSLLNGGSFEFDSMILTDDDIFDDSVVPPSEADETESLRTTSREKTILMQSRKRCRKDDNVIGMEEILGTKDAVQMPSTKATKGSDEIAFLQKGLSKPNTSKIPTTSENRVPVVLGSGRCIPVSREHDAQNLSNYQLCIREHIEFFEATEADMHEVVQGRRHPIHLGQVGIRCRHCKHMARSTANRKRAATYFPARLNGIYQTAQNMARAHFLAGCAHIPSEAKDELNSLKTIRKTTSGGKRYWASSASAAGLREHDGKILVFDDSVVHQP